MVGATCHRCGREWNYTGGSDHYGTCPNCKTSVKLETGSERAGPADSPEAEPPGPCRTTSDRETVEVEAGGHELREVSLVEAVEALDDSVSELYELQESQSEAVDDVAQNVEKQSEAVDSLEDGVKEVAGYFAEFIELNGGEVEYDHISRGGAVPEALKNFEVA